MTLDEQVAIITGGTRGIGLAVARRLAADGCNLVLVYKSDDEQAATAEEELRALGAQVWLHKGDLRKMPTVRGLFDVIKQGPDRIDILIHNAAFGAMGALDRIGPASWNATFEVNVTTLLTLAQRALPWLRKRGGSIIGMSSIGSQVCYSDYAAMGCSKAAMEALIRYMAFEFISEGIRCNCVSGGPIETRALGSFKDPDAVRNYARGMGPVGRMGTPQDMVGAVRFLVGSEASWMVGQTLLCDGGITLGIDFDDWKKERS